MDELGLDCLRKWFTLEWIAQELPKIRAKTEFCLYMGELGPVTVKLERLLSQVNSFETTSLAKYPNLRPLSLLKP